MDTFLKLRFGWLMPALLMRMSTRPWRLAISAPALATSFWSATSSAMVSQLPTALTSFSAFLRVSALRPEITTCAPARASSMPPARPMPDPPPVIQTTLSFDILGSAEKVLLLLLRHFARTARVLQHIERALHRRSLEQRVAPALERRELLDVDALPLGKAQPRYGGDVGDGVLVASEVFGFLQPAVDHAIKTIGFVLVAVHRVLDLLGRVAEEVVSLAEHRPDVTHLEHGPLHHLPALAKVGGQELSRLGSQIEKHGTRLGERERLAARAVGIDHRRHLVVRRDFEELGLELVALADIDRDHAVRRAGLLHHDVNLVPVRCGPGIEIDHSFTRVLRVVFLGFRPSINR